MQVTALVNLMNKTIQGALHKAFEALQQGAEDTLKCTLKTKF